MFALEPLRSVLVVAPHPDDEVLGAGGLIAKLREADVRVFVIFSVVDGFHHYGLDRATSLAERQTEIEKVASILGFEHETLYAGKRLIEQLDTLPLRDLVNLFEEKYNELRPDLLLLPHGVDYDQDHVACYRA